MITIELLNYLSNKNITQDMINQLCAECWYHDHHYRIKTKKRGKKC